MKRIFSFNNDSAKLYLVATPIGNLEDMTIRAIRILKEVDYIYAEDTRTSKVLLDHFDIKTPCFSYHEFNQDLKEKEIIDLLKKKINIAIISDAGLPVISDPGYKIALAAIEEDIIVTTIPGASAGISALIASGLSPMPFQFIGFLDSKKQARIKMLEEIKYYSHTTIFYESPHRINETIKDIYETLGNRKLVLARELTKKFEEFIRGNAFDLIDLENVKGEIVLLIEGFKDEISKDVDYNILIDEHIKLGMKPNEAIKEVAKMHGEDRKELYANYVAYKDIDK